MNPPCDFEELVSLQAAELLDEAGQARLSAHLPACERCRGAAGSLRQVIARASLPLDARDEHAIAGIALLPSPRSARRPARVYRMVAAGALAAAAVLAVAVLATRRVPSSTAPLPVARAKVVPAHSPTVSHPEVASRPVVKDAAASQLAQDLDVPASADEGDSSLDDALAFEAGELPYSVDGR